MRHLRSLVALAVLVLVIGAVWSTGAVDEPLHLYSLGLNARDCFRDYNGTVTCGASAHVRCRDRVTRSFEIAETTCYTGRAP